MKAWQGWLTVLSLTIAGVAPAWAGPCQDLFFALADYQGRLEARVGDREIYAEGKDLILVSASKSAIRDRKSMKGEIEHIAVVSRDSPTFRYGFVPTIERVTQVVVTTPREIVVYEVKGETKELRYVSHIELSPKEERIIGMGIVPMNSDVSAVWFVTGRQIHVLHTHSGGMAIADGQAFDAPIRKVDVTMISASDRTAFYGDRRHLAGQVAVLTVTLEGGKTEKLPILESANPTLRAPDREGEP